MENTKKLIITPITETTVVGYKAEPVYTFDELQEHYYNADGFIMDDFVKEVPTDV